MKKLLLLFLLLPTVCFADFQLVDESGNTTFMQYSSGSYAGGMKIPYGTANPANCEVGQLFLNTTATTGRRIYSCESTNTWVLQGDGNSGGSPTWGTIIGTLSSQTDLQSALDGKQASGSYAFNTTYMNTTAPLSGGGNLSADRTLSIPKATTSVDGYLNATDWTTFNNKLSTVDISANSNLAVSAPITLTGDSVGMVNQGTTTTVLHGNASGNPSFAANTFADYTGTSAATSATTGTMTVNMTTDIITITPTGACTFNAAAGGNLGQIVTFSITTSGTTSYTLTFGTNFRKVGTLATGTTSARFFAVTFRYVATNTWQEIARTAVQT